MHYLLNIEERDLAEKTVRRNGEQFQLDDSHTLPIQAIYENRAAEYANFKSPYIPENSAH